MSVFISVVPENSREIATQMGLLAADIEKATYRALNVAADRTRTKLDKLIRSQVNFPAAFLRPSAGNLVVSDRARKDNLEVVIRGRDRPTSLARFATMSGSAKTVRRGKVSGVPVMVSPGRRKFIKGAFRVNLRNGGFGIAVRTAPGQRPRGAFVPKRLDTDLWLLYGPSIDQVLHGVRSRNDGLFGDVAPESAEIFEAEFWRLIDAGIV